MSGWPFLARPEEGSMDMSEAAHQLHMPSRRSSEGEVDLLAVLEERLASLVERHREALKTIEELESQLVESSARMAELERRFDARDGLRREARSRMQAAIGRLEEIESALAAQAAGGSGDGG